MKDCEPKSAAQIYLQKDEAFLLQKLHDGFGWVIKFNLTKICQSLKF